MIRVFKVVLLASIYLGVEAFVLMKLWIWFISPLGVLQLSFAQSLGIVVLLDYIRSPVVYYHKEEFKDNPLAQIMCMLLLLSLGFAIHFVGGFY